VDLSPELIEVAKGAVGDRTGGVSFALGTSLPTGRSIRRRLLLISERHELVGVGDDRVSDYRFVMRCWEREELDMLFARHGFGKIRYFGAYDRSVEFGATDRLVAVAQLSDDADKS
jgi:hypothetical protein